ncbi:MAG: T9SS type A sorting domain-containing protein, partial [Muribaculaceae bacterium]|nr:T9SS type A sorting domain-containing protein [Muribaculaceae bacterium]
SYIYSFSGDDSSVKYDWVDIETTGLGVQNDMNYYLMHDYVTVDLPFEFPFYGRKYSRMYVYNTGFISFTERRDDKIWPEPPAEFPEGSIFTNIIAPYWGLHSMDQTKTAGTFHYETEDRAVVSFIEYGNSMNIGVDFQVILDRDGSFKFQYKGAFDGAIIYNIFGLAGICDADGTNSIRLPERMVVFDNAVAFSPVRMSAVAPGASETIGFDFDTKRMAGSYDTALHLTSNVPGKENGSIPVSLTVTGTSAPVWPTDVTCENVLGYQSTDYTNPLVQMGAMYDVQFKVSNEGTAPFTITDIAVGGPTIYDDWFGVEMPAFTLFANMPEIDWITGEPTGRKMWSQYERGFTVFTVGEDPAEFSLPMLPNEFAYTPGTYTVPMVFTIDTERGTEEHTVTVTFVVTPAPAMTLGAEEIRVKAVADSDSFTEALTLGNEGQYKLTYTVTLDPTGIGEEDDDLGGGGIAPWSTAQAAPESVRALAKASIAARAGEEYSVLDAPADFDFRGVLCHTSLNGANYNYGANTLYDTFKAATIFTAPAEGFNVSHIYLPVDIRTATDYTISFELVSGDTPGEGDVLGRGKLYIASQQGAKFYIVNLDRSVFINPGETFHLIATYPAGVAMPAYLVPKQDAVVPGRYMAWVESYGWYDAAQLFQDQYGSLGYPMSCLETVEGKPWIKLLSAGEGTVETGTTADIKVEINAAAARLEKNNKAMLVIKTNDPAMLKVNFPVYLDKNGAPVIDAPEGVVYAKEGEVTSVTVTVTDPDGDDFTITFADPSGLATVKTVTSADGTAAESGEGSYAVTGAATMTVDIAPDFGDAAAGKAFTVTAADSHGLEAEAAVRYDIEHVNRAPVAVADFTVELAEGSTSAVVAFADLFTDPDGDELTFTFDMPANAVAEAYPNSTGVIFFGKKLGSAKAIVTATDPSGASTRLELPVEVKDLSGIDGVNAATGSLTVTPNPVDGDINAFCGFDADNAVFALYDAAGRLVASHTADVSAGAATVIPAAGLPQGVYILTVASDSVSATARIIKR